MIAIQFHMLSWLAKLIVVSVMNRYNLPWWFSWMVLGYGVFEQLMMTGVFWANGRFKESATAEEGGKVE